MLGQRGIHWLRWPRGEAENVMFCGCDLRLTLGGGFVGFVGFFLIFCVFFPSYVLCLPAWLRKTER